jgi:hypothetical protein
MFVFLANAQRTITVTGPVQDSATGSPVAGALVLLLDTNTISIDLTKLTGLQFDSTVSGADGKISYNMKIATNSYILGYAIVKQGYQLVYNGAAISPTATTVSLGVIKIAASGATPLDTLTVSGKVVDSLTNVGLGGALVVMSGLGAVDTASGNRVLTNADGTFSKQVIISELNNSPIVGYVVNQLGYTTKIGEKLASGKQLDLGTIPLSPNLQAVRRRPLNFSEKLLPDRMVVYALNGNVLYEGPLMSFGGKVHGKNVPVLEVFKRNGIVVDIRQIVSTR